MTDDFEVDFTKELQLVEVVFEQPKPELPPVAPGDVDAIILAYFLKTRELDANGKWRIC